MYVEIFELTMLIITSLGFGLFFGFFLSIRENLNEICDAIKVMKYDELLEENKHLKETICILEEEE